MKRAKGSVLALSSSFFKLSVLCEDAGISVFISNRANRACSEREGRPLSRGCILGRELLSIKSSVNLYLFTLCCIELGHGLCLHNCSFVQCPNVKSWTGHPGSDPGLNTVCVSAEGS